MLIDGHNDLAWAMRQLHNYDFDALDLSQYAPALHTDLSRLGKGGVTGQFWSVYAPSTLSVVARQRLSQLNRLCLCAPS